MPFEEPASTSQLERLLLHTRALKKHFQRVQFLDADTYGACTADHTGHREDRTRSWHGVYARRMNRTLLGRPSLVLILLPLAIAACGPSIVREDQASRTRETEDAVRVCANGPTVEGIDVSHWQGPGINWAAVAGSGKAFAIMKATEGTTYTDDTFAVNWSGSARAGMIRGAYHYFHPSVDPVAQANRFADVMGPLSAGDLPPMLDLEDADRLSPAAVAQSTRTFLTTLESRTGRRPMIYTGYYFWRDQVGDPPGFSGYPLVMAAYVSGCPMVPASWGRFTMWQYTSSGRVPGISGNVDLDQFNGDLNALRALAGGGGSTDPICPGGGDYCGGDEITGGDPDTLYHCTRAGVPATAEPCPNGCQVMPHGVPDVCRAPGPTCPGPGDYCGSDGIAGGDPDTLYHCPGAGMAPSSSEFCANGCQSLPPGIPDVCY